MKEHPIYKGYFLDTDGNVYSNKRMNKTIKLKASINQKGYHRVRITVDGVGKLHSVSRLMMQTYVGYSDLEVDHINRDKGDNRLSNLRYVTRSENVLNRDVGIHINVYDTYTNTTIQYDSVVEFINDVGVIGDVSNVYKALKRQYRYLKRYIITEQ